jgi:hypothetical protein
MLQKRHSLKDNSPSQRKKNKNRKRQYEGDQREDKPKDHGLGGMYGSKKTKKEDRTWSHTPIHTDLKKDLEGSAPSLVEAQFGKGKCARCDMDNHGWKFCWNSVVSSSSKGKTPKPKDDDPTDVLSAAGANGSTPKAQVSASI